MHTAVQDELARRQLGRFIEQGWPYIDPSTYIPNWHIDVVCEHLQYVSSGELTRLILNIPPRTMKSLSTSVAWPAWVWLERPEKRWLFASYAQTLSFRDATKSRRLIQSPWYQRLLAGAWALGEDKWEFTSDQNAKVKFENTRLGYRLSTSVGGMTTGEGGDIIVADDPHNATEALSEAERANVVEWWEGAMSTRLNNPNTGAYVIVMQRLHELDLTGHVLRKDDTGWYHLCLPMRYEPNHVFVYGKDVRHRGRDPRTVPGELLWPARVGEGAVVEMTKTLGSYRAAGQLQQLPAPAEGGMFKRAWFREVPALPAGVRSARGWDLAASDTITSPDPDATASVKLSLDKAGLLYVSSGLSVQELGHVVERMLQTVASQDGKKCAIAIPQDPGQAGKAQVAYYLRQLPGYIVYTNTMTGAKEVRAQPVANQAEVGNVCLVRTGSPAQDAWIEPFLDQLCTFPNAAHDDWVDALSLAYEALSSKLAIPVATPVGFDVASPYAI
jgi:predicted phage terminase large subunit-like protein